MSASIAGQNVRADNLNMARPMRNGPPAITRPIQPPGTQPLVASASGLGTGGGAGLSADSDGAWGHVKVFVGVGAANTGVIVVNFPVTPPAGASGLFWTANWATLVVTGTNPYTVTWTAPGALNPTGYNSLKLAYEWNVAD